MINIKKQGFTLVELIVVITILAILGSIAFISLQGYSADARNSKRASDLSSMQSTISVGQANGTALSAYVTPVTANILTPVSIAGTGTVAGHYTAGDVNYSALGVKVSDFTDPKGEAYSYKIGYTDLAGGAFELAATYELSGGYKAKLIGNWKPRTTSNTATLTPTATGATTYTIASTDINKFKLGDETTQGVIKSISNDGTSITTTTAAASIATVTCALNANETSGLIASVGGVTIPVVNESPTALPYSINQ